MVPTKLIQTFDGPLRRLITTAQGHIVRRRAEGAAAALPLPRPFPPASSASPSPGEPIRHHYRERDGANAAAAVLSRITHAGGLTLPAAGLTPVAAPLARPESEKRVLDQLLGYFKQTAEVREYRKFYAGTDAHRVAVIRVSGDVLTSAEKVKEVAASLSFLHRIGLIPIVVHGAGLYTGRRAAAALADGSDLASAARQYMLDANTALCNALKAEGVEAASFTTEIFKAEKDDDGKDEGFGSISGRIVGVREHLLAAAVETNRIPVVAALGETDSPASAAAAAAEGEDEGYVSGDDAASDAERVLTFPTLQACIAIAKSLKPLKVVWLRPEGGLKTVAAADGASASSAVVRTIDFNDETMPSVVSNLHPSDASLLPELKTLYDESSSDTGGFSVSVTAPSGLAAELFTSRGEGTVLLRREKILCIDGADVARGDAVDLGKVRSLIEEAFGAQLPEDYFTSMLPSIDGKDNAAFTGTRVLRRLYLSQNYRGVAVVTEEKGLASVAYLDKFAVSKSSQGDKLGEALWKVMMAHENGRLYWRSKTANKVNPWYFEQSEGCFKNPSWTVFWCGLKLEETMQAVSTALALKATFPLKVYPQQSAKTFVAAGATLQPSLK